MSFRNQTERQRSNSEIADCTVVRSSAPVTKTWWQEWRKWQAGVARGWHWTRWAAPGCKAWGPVCKTEVESWCTVRWQGLRSRALWTWGTCCEVWRSQAFPAGPPSGTPSYVRLALPRSHPSWSLAPLPLPSLLRSSLSRISSRPCTERTARPHSQGLSCQRLKLAPL